jgi:hypothetical protein
MPREGLNEGLGAIGEQRLSFFAAGVFCMFASGSMLLLLGKRNPARTALAIAAGHYRMSAAEQHWSIIEPRMRRSRGSIPSDAILI